MSVKTVGKIKGYVSPEDVFAYIKNNYDENATSDAYHVANGYSFEDIPWDYKINEHSVDVDFEYTLSGHINFKMDGKDYSLFYYYCNVNHLENLGYYDKIGLKDMVEAETTTISLPVREDEDYWIIVNAINTMVFDFGGGWLDAGDGYAVAVHPKEL